MIAAILFAAAVTVCHPVESGKIYGRDLAAASESFAAAPADAVAGYAPAPGMRRIFDAGELARFARANHLDVPALESLCFERAAAVPDPERIREAMLKSLGDPQAHLEIASFSQFRVPSGEMIFPRESLGNLSPDGSVLWNGYVTYDGGRFPLWARVRLSLHQRRLVAVADLAPGRILSAQDFRLEEVDEFPSRQPALAGSDDAVGRTPRRVIIAGTALTAGVLEMPNDVERGQVLMVEARSGAAVVKVEARVETSGKRGQTVSLRNPVSGKLFHARVEGKGIVVVDCESAQ